MAEQEQAVYIPRVKCTIAANPEMISVRGESDLILKAWGTRRAVDGCMQVFGHSEPDAEASPRRIAETPDW